MRGNQGLNCGLKVLDLHFQTFAAKKWAGDKIKLTTDIYFKIM